MKNKIFLLAMITWFGVQAANAQETPKPSPQPPTSVPAPPQATPKPPAPPTPPTAPEASGEKSDTTIFSIGDKQVIIINQRNKKEGGRKEEWERELEEEMMELQAELEEARAEMEREKSHMDKAKSEMERQKELEHLDAMGENEAPDGKQKNKFKLKKEKKFNKRNGADIDFLNFDLGINILSFDASVPEQLEKDLKLKTFNSWNYTFTFLPTKIYLGTPRLMIMTGLGWRIAQFEFKEKVNFEPNKTLAYSKNDTITKSQFSIHQLQLPLSLYFESKRIKGLGNVGFGIGGYAGILIHQQHESETNNPDRSIETEEDYGFEEFRYGLSARLDVGAIKLYANMDLNNLWKDNDIKNIECGIWLDF
jgi:hypothetical protein